MEITLPTFNSKGEQQAVHLHISALSGTSVNQKYAQFFRLLVCDDDGGIIADVNVETSQLNKATVALMY